MSFKPAWWLKNCHLQTIYPSLFRTVKSALAIRRERIVTPDDDFIDVDFCGDDTSQPIVIMLHGLTGSSQSGYIQGLQTKFSSLGYRTAALNFRGCSGEPNNRARSYHSGETEDTHFLYRTLREREPNTPIAAVGFSLGGNVLLKWLGEQGEGLDVFAAVAVSVPLLLNLCATKLDNGFSKVYRKRLIDELKDYIDKKRMHLQQIGRHEDAVRLRDIGDLSRINSFWEYDNDVVAALHGFKDVHDYYGRSSSRQFLKAIAVPTLVIQAADDPFMTKDVLPGPDELSESVQMELTRHGGHVGFISGPVPFKPVYWLEQRIPDFIDAMLASRRT